MADRPRLVTGARVVCYINGKMMGRVTGFYWQSITNRKEIRGIDVTYPLELAPTTTLMTGSLRLERIIGDGGLQGAGAVASQPDISREKYFTLLLVERAYDVTLFKADYCVANVENWGVDAKGKMVGTLSFMGITWGNEATR